MRGTHAERALERLVIESGGVCERERILTACSGGPDSVALTALCAALASKLHLKLEIAHVNHATRASAWQDEAVVLRLGAALGLPVHVLALSLPSHDEATLRDARYAALLACARARELSSIACAHHAEDQSETVLLALFRGSGPEGLTGMPVRRELAPGIDLVRPLLRASAAELAGYCHAQALAYVVDPTNEERALRRNAVRAALAQLRPHFAGLDTAVARAAMLFSDEREGTSRARLRTQVREALRDEDALRDVSFEHVEAAVRMLERGGSGRFELGADLVLYVEGQALRVERGR